MNTSTRSIFEVLLDGVLQPTVLGLVATDGSRSEKTVLKALIVTPCQVSSPDAAVVEMLQCQAAPSVQRIASKERSAPKVQACSSKRQSVLAVW